MLHLLIVRHGHVSLVDSQTQTRVSGVDSQTHVSLVDSQTQTRVSFRC